MNKYYFVAGEFCAEGMGRNYIGYGAKFLIVHSDTYEQAYNLAFEYAQSIFGEHRYTDMWYGLIAWNWQVEPYTLHGFKKIYKSRFDLICYHTVRASLLFTGKSKNSEELQSITDEFIKNHPIIEIYSDKIEAFSGDINDILDTRPNIEVQKDIEPMINNAEAINCEETTLDKIFFE